MPVINLFGPPEPEDKNVIGTADVINYFPKLNLQEKLLWEQRPGLMPFVLTEPIPPSGCLECISYPTSDGYIDFWEIDNVTKTFHCPIIVPDHLQEGGIWTGIRTSTETLPFPNQKRTITLTSRTVSNPGFYTTVLNAEGTPILMDLMTSPVTNILHFNISEEQNDYIVFWSWSGLISFIAPSTYSPQKWGEIYIDCFRIEARDWEAQGEELINYYVDDDGYP